MIVWAENNSDDIVVYHYPIHRGAPEDFKFKPSPAHIKLFFIFICHHGFR